MEQLTLSQWIETKEAIKRELFGVQSSFIRIGYHLRVIEEQKLYELDGYKTLSEFAAAEYNLGASSVSRFKSLNERYSVDGYSPNIVETYAEMGQSKLVDMLSLPAEDEQLITADMPRTAIRELKSFNKTESTDKSGLDAVIIEFFKQNKEELNAIHTEDSREIEEIMCPSGARTFKKGLYFLTMIENGIKIKKFGEGIVDMSWLEFLAKTKEIFEEAADGAKTYNNYFGAEEKEEKAEEIKEEVKIEDSKQDKTLKSLSATPIAPAQYTEEKEPKKEEKEDEIEENDIEEEEESIENHGEIQESVVLVEKIQEKDVEIVEEPHKAYVREELEELKNNVIRVSGNITRIDNIDWNLLILLIDEKLEEMK